MNTTKTSLLEVAFTENGSQSGFPVICIHGWPDDALTWNRVTPHLVEAGFRVITPYLRGCGPTRFRDANASRSGQLVALGLDLVEFAASLGLERYAVVGHDWGARAAANACGLRPGVASHLVMISVGYGTNTPDQPLSLRQVRNYWYHWYMATPRGERTVREDRRAFARILWDTWAPPGWYDDAEFAATAQAFDNDDWPDVTLHSYRHRWGHAAGDPYYAADEATLHPAPVLDVPTLVLHGAQDGANHPDTSLRKEQLFRGGYERMVLEGVGHFPPREVAALVTAELLRCLASKQPLTMP